MTRRQYPRRGHRLAPATLREWLQDPVPAKYLAVAVGHGLSAGTRLCDLDETAWRRFGDSLCRELAQQIVRTAGCHARMSSSIGSRHLPPIPDGMTLTDLDLDVRTLNCLVSAGIHERPQDIHSMTIDGILGIRGFGVKSLVGLLSSLEYVTDHPEARKPDNRKPGHTDVPIAIKHLRAAHRYPRPDHRLAPQTLKEILLDPIPPRLVRNTPFRKARLCDLDETVWKHVSPEVIARLAGLIVSRAGAAAGHDGIMRRRLPKPPEGMRLEDLRLENRTHNCLQRQGFARHPDRLRELTVADLLLIRAFGSKCLVDLLASLETLVAREGKLDPGLTAEAEALGQMAEAHQIQFIDPRLGSRLRAVDTESNTIEEMVERFVKRRLDPPDAAGVRGQLAELRSAINRLSKLPLEEELEEIFAVSDSRDQQIVAQYYGWDGHGSHTLEEVGQRYGLSRERIRQVCARAIKRNQNAAVFAPVLDRALAFLSERLPIGLVKLQAEFDAAGFSRCGLPIESIRKAGTFLGRRPEFEVIDAGFRRLVVSPEDLETPRTVAQAAKQMVANFGVARIAQVLDELTGRYGRKIDANLLRETLQTGEDFCWLDENRTWFRLDSFPQYGLPNMIEKVLSVIGSIEVSKLWSAVARYRRNTRKLPPRKILLEYCRQMPGTRVEDRLVISDPPRDWRKILVGVERCLVEVFTEHGSVMERSALEECCARRGVNRFSFNAIIMSSPVIAQYGRRVYGLLGQKVDQKAVQQLLSRRPGSAPSRVLRAFGQTPHGDVYLAYQLSKAAISGGVITVPAAMKRRLRGKFTLRTDQGHEVGTLVAKKGCGWGLGPALRGSHAKQGDHMLLLFDTAKRQAQIRIGDETILDGTIPDEAGRQGDAVTG